MEPVFIYGSTVLVFWAVAAIPMCLRDERYLLLAISGAFVFGGHAFLFLQRDYSQSSFFAATGSFLFAVAGGFLKHRFDKNEEQT